MNLHPVWIGLGLVTCAPLVQASPPEEACRLLRTPAIHEAFPGARGALCEQKPANCRSLHSEDECAGNSACQAHRGSGSGPGCVRCTPDWVFQYCEDLPKERLASVIAEYAACLKKKGHRWEQRNSIVEGYCAALPAPSDDSEPPPRRPLQRGIKKSATVAPSKVQ